MRCGRRDVATAPSRLTLVGESAAGRGTSVRLGPGETVRIFTGAPLPPGADAILIQENASADGTAVTALEAVAAGRHIRPAGQDFHAGEVLLKAGRRLGASDIALAAAMNHPALPCARRPRVAILATGDELVSPGETPGPDQIVASNSFAVAALVETPEARCSTSASHAMRWRTCAARSPPPATPGRDLLVTLGGASVGDHDLVQRALVESGMSLDFWRIAMRPGKPLMHGRLGGMQVLGLPGNPVSAIVCGLLFVRPLVRRSAVMPMRRVIPHKRERWGATSPPTTDGRTTFARG